MQSATGFSERHLLGHVVGELQADLSRCDAKKLETWPTFIDNEKNNPPKIEVSASLNPVPREATGIIFWDFHNVADYDLSRFVSICSNLNARQIESQIISFVGRGTASHANVLMTCSHPDLQQVVSELVLVFNKGHPLKGKGHILREWSLANPEKKLIFVDDGACNLENVFRCLTAPCLLIHLVIEKSSQEEETPHFATRVDSYEKLLELIDRTF